VVLTSIIKPCSTTHPKAITLKPGCTRTSPRASSSAAVCVSRSLSYLLWERGGEGGLNISLFGNRGRLMSPLLGDHVSGKARQGAAEGQSHAGNNSLGPSWARQ
jgi:hypothetical protein